MGTHDFKLKKVPFPTLQKVNINVLRSAAPELALVPASRYNCDVQCAFFARKPVNFDVSRSAAPKLALVPASCYMCDVKQSNLKVCAKFH